MGGSDPYELSEETVRKREEREAEERRKEERKKLERQREEEAEQKRREEEWERQKKEASEWKQARLSDEEKRFTQKEDDYEKYLYEVPYSRNKVRYRRSSTLSSQPLALIAIRTALVLETYLRMESEIRNIPQSIRTMLFAFSCCQFLSLILSGICADKYKIRAVVWAADVITAGIAGLLIYMNWSTTMGIELLILVGGLPLVILLIVLAKVVMVG